MSITDYELSRTREFYAYEPWTILNNFELTLNKLEPLNRPQTRNTERWTPTAKDQQLKTNRQPPIND